MPILREAENPHILSLSPPLNLDPKWLGAHTGYTLAKYGMTMVDARLRGRVREGRASPPTRCGRATTIATAAVQNAARRRHGDGRQPHARDLRGRRVRGAHDARRASTPGQTLIVEDVLTDAGITDFSRYAAVPGTPDDRLFPDIFLWS